MSVRNDLTGYQCNTLFDNNGWYVRLPEAESKAYCYYVPWRGLRVRNWET